MCFLWSLSTRPRKKFFYYGEKCLRHVSLFFPIIKKFAFKDLYDFEPLDRHSTAKHTTGESYPEPTRTYAAAGAAAPCKTITTPVGVHSMWGFAPLYPLFLFLSIRGRVASLPPQRLEGVLSMWGFAPPYPPRCTINHNRHRLYTMITDIPLLIVLIVVGLYLTIFTRRGGRP